MDRRTFIKAGSMAAAAASLHACKSSETPPVSATSATAGATQGQGTRMLSVTVHGGFAHIFQRRNGTLQSLLFGPARAIHGHPHGLRMRINKEALKQPPETTVPYGVMSEKETDFYVWDLLGWDVEFRPDDTVPSGELKVTDNSPLESPDPAADWNRLSHIPDLSAHGAGALKDNFRAWMSSSVLLHGGEIKVLPPSEPCAQYAVLKFGNATDQAVSDRLQYEVPFSESVVLGIQGLGLPGTKVALAPSDEPPKILHIDLDFVPVSTEVYSDGKPLLHYGDLNALGRGTGIIPRYFQRKTCPGQPSPGIYCPPGRYTRDI